MQVLVLDNYDSFVFNLVQYLGQLGVDELAPGHETLDVGGDVVEQAGTREFRQDVLHVDLAGARADGGQYLDTIARGQASKGVWNAIVIEASVPPSHPATRWLVAPLVVLWIMLGPTGRKVSPPQV